MLVGTPPEPDAIPATGDPGDDTAARYRYQWTYAGIVCCVLLDESEDVVEVFCEHHEDILLKHTDGLFSGLQVKTRGQDQDLWNTADEAVVGTCARFAKLERDFPGRFRAFRFLTNHPLQATANGRDLSHVLGLVEAAPDLAGLQDAPTKRFLQRVATAAGVSEVIAFAALRKTSADASLPRLDDVEMRLASTLAGVWPGASQCVFEALKRAARSLARECGDASSLNHHEVLPGYLPILADAQAAELAARINGKRMTKERIQKVLEDGRDQLSLLDSPDSAAPLPPGSTDLMKVKLDTGGFSVTSRNSAEDLRDKADYIGVVWTKKFGNSQGVQRYKHIKSIVLRDAAAAFEDVQTDQGRFGLRMLARLRERFRERRSERAVLFDCSDEHLEGFAYLLTAECKVQWSHEQPWAAK